MFSRYLNFCLDFFGHVEKELDWKDNFNVVEKIFLDLFLKN